MAELPTQTPTVDAIYLHYTKAPQERRAYLGASMLGTECRRALWLSFRWAARPSFPGRILRLFETGAREEDRLIKNLRDIGMTVEGEQHEVVCCGGHVKGHFDGVIKGLLEAPKTWHLLELKTMNDRNFKAFVKKGVQESHPKYYSQMQLYMGEEKLKRAALIAQCKNDDQIHIERVNYDKAHHNGLLRKASAILSAESPPERISEDPDFWKCRFCDMRMMCHDRVFPDVNCRTCVHSKPVMGGDGAWECAVEKDMWKECDGHLYIPGLLHWLEPVSGSPTHIEYEKFVNVTAEGFAGVDKPMRMSRELQGG